MVGFSVRALSSLGKALLLGVVATLVACGGNALGPERGAEGRRSAADDGTPFYYYDHQPIYLTVDSARMVVLPNDALAVDSVSVRDALSGYVTYLIEPSPGSHGDVLKIANAIDESSIALWGSPDMVRPAMGPTSLLITE